MVEEDSYTVYNISRMAQVIDQYTSESRKKNLAITAIATLAALNGEGVTVYIIIAISAIALSGMSLQGFLDWLKNKVDKTPKV